MVNKWCTLNYTLYEIHYWRSWRKVNNWMVADSCLNLFKKRPLVCYCPLGTVFYIFSNGMLDKIVLLFCLTFCYRVMNISWNILYIQNPFSSSSVLRVRSSLHTGNLQEGLHIDRKICMWRCGWRFVMKSEGAGSWSQRALWTVSCLSYLPASYRQL